MFLSADKIHDGKCFLPENTVLEIDESGTIIALHHGKVAGAVQHLSLIHI